jgi:phosphoenolpyruvate synthase/pyruvate phosphate dikinase
MDLLQIKNDDLTYFGERIEPYFASSIILRGMLDKKNLKKALQWNAGVRWVYTNNYFFILKKDLALLQEFLKQKFKKDGVKYTKSLIKNCNAYGNKLIRVSRQVKNKSLGKKLTTTKMRDLLVGYVNAASNYMIFQNIALVEGAVSETALEIAKKYSKSEGEANKLLSTITVASAITGGEKEQDDFLKMCTTKNPKRNAAKHAEKYGWLSIRFFVGNAWTEKDVLARINAANSTDAKKELEKRIVHRKEREQQIAQTIKGFSKTDKDLVGLVRDLVFLRTQRTDFFQQSSFYVQPLVKEIAKNFDMTYDELLYLSGAEVLLALEGKLNAKEVVEKRKIGFIVLFDSDEDKILDGAEANQLVKELPILNRDSAQAGEIIGKTGYGGKAIGKARIVKSDKDNSKVEQGDILVSMMTTPNFIPAMERAAAFVTDEGGITCHAAIIAREMKKPCVIGTKNATKLIHDGDLIEVDADKGTVKIISKAK